MLYSVRTQAYGGERNNHRFDCDPRLETVQTKSDSHELWGVGSGSTSQYIVFRITKLHTVKRFETSETLPFEGK